MNKFAECRERAPQFASFLEKAQLGGFLSLDSYLIMPVQRILRYKLLLEEILKHTHHDDEDYKDLKTALEIISERGVGCNEASRRRENMQALKRIQDKLHDVEIASPKRYGNLGVFGFDVRLRGCRCTTIVMYAQVFVAHGKFRIIFVLDQACHHNATRGTAAGTLRVGRSQA